MLLDTHQVSDIPAYNTSTSKIKLFWSIDGASSVSTNGIGIIPFIEELEQREEEKMKKQSEAQRKRLERECKKREREAKKMNKRGIHTQQKNGRRGKNRTGLGAPQIDSECERDGR